MFKAVYAFGAAALVAGMFIYPRPTLFTIVMLFVFLIVMSEDPEDKE